MAAGFLDHCDAARAAVSKGDLSLGRKHFEAALKIKPDAIDARYGLATICYLQKDVDSAMDQFAEVQRLDPLHAGSAINLGALFNLKGDYEKAIVHLRRGIQLDRTRSEGYYNLGIAYRKLGKLELAIQAYREAHHLNPRMVEPIYNLANIYKEMERIEQAISHYRQALEINPGFRKARESLELLENKLNASKNANQATADAAMETPTDDPLEGDERLDRMLDPEKDSELLARLHAETSEAMQMVSAWVKYTEDLDEAVRTLAVHVTSSSEQENLRGAMLDMARALGKFEACINKFSEKKAQISEISTQLIEHA